MYYGDTTDLQSIQLIVANVHFFAHFIIISLVSDVNFLIHLRCVMYFKYFKCTYMYIMYTIKHVYLFFYKLHL